MRIAYFNATLVQGFDGVTRVVFKMIEEALSHKSEVMAISAQFSATPELNAQLHSVPSVTFPLQRSYNLALPGYRKFVKELHQFHPDIIHINSPCTLGFAAVKYAREFRIPVVATYHTHFPSYPRYYHLNGCEEIIWKIQRKFYNNVDRTFVPSPVILQELQKHGIQHTQYLPNGVDHELFTPTRRSNQWRKNILGEHDDKPIVLFVSRLVWEKDLRTLAAMYAELQAKRNDFQMVVVGQGHAREEFEAMMPGAIFLGYQSGTALAECYASSDIFVFPSTTETFGLVTLEAMSSGIAPIVSNAGGQTGIIEHGRSGLFFEPMNAHQMSQQVELLLDNEHQRNEILRGAFERSKTFRWNAVCSSLFDQYSDVISTYGRKSVVQYPLVG